MCTVNVFSSFKGIGVVYVTLTDEEGRQVIAQPSFPNLQYSHASREELSQIKDKLLKFKHYQKLTEQDDEYSRICYFRRNRQKLS